jgi:hypothetical protein
MRTSATTTPYSYSSSSMSERRSTSISEALKKVDFLDKPSVITAHKDIVDMVLLDREIGWFFYGGSKAKALDGIATLVLHKTAKTQEECSFIPGDRANAIYVLANEISPVGQNMLLRELESLEAKEVPQPNDVFSKYMDRSDMHFLAASKLELVLLPMLVDPECPALGDVLDSMEHHYDAAANAYNEGGHSSMETIVLRHRRRTLDSSEDD